jgi:hypothetical protein
MGLCSKVDDRVDVTLVHDKRNEIRHSDVTLDKSIVRAISNVTVVVLGSAVIELVEVDHIVLRELEHHLAHKVRAAKDQEDQKMEYMKPAPPVTMMFLISTF